MRVRWLSTTFAALALALPACGRDETVVMTTSSLPADATHGGDVVFLGDARFEVVHDASTGAVTLYQLRSDRTVVLAEAPSVEIRTGTETVPVVFTRVSDGVWSASHASLRGVPSGEARLVARIGGTRFDEPLLASNEPTTTVTPASVPSAEGTTPVPSDDMPAPAEAKPASSDASETTLSLEGGGHARVARRAGEITVTATDADGRALAVEKAVLVFGTKETVLVRSGDAWTARFEPAAAAPGRLVLTIEGRERVATFPASWSEAPATTTDAPAPAADAPREPAPVTTPASSDSSSAKAATRTLSLEGGATANLTHDPKSGTLTIRFSGSDGAVLRVEKAVLVVDDASESDGTREIELAAPDAAGEWTASGDALKAPLAGRLLLTIDGKERSVALTSTAAASSTPAPAPAPAPADEPAPPAPPAPAGDDERRMIASPPVFPAGAPLADEEPVNPPDPHPEPAGKPGPANPPGQQADSNASEARVALEGSFLLGVKDTDLRVEVLHDKDAGKLTVQPLQGDVPVLLDEAPVLFLASSEPAGVGKATLNRMEGKPVFWVIHTELKDRDLLGKLRFKLAGREHEVDLAGPHLVVAPTTFVMLGTDRLVVDHDHSVGTIGIRGAGRFASLTFLARLADGRTVPVALTAVPGRPGEFRATHEALRTARLDGRVTTQVDGRSVEGAIQTTTSAAGAARSGSTTPSTPPPAGSGSGTGSGTGR